MYALKEATSTARLGKPIWFRFWTKIGPCTTDDEAERALFHTRDQPELGLVIRRSTCLFDVVDVGAGPGDPDWDRPS